MVCFGPNIDRSEEREQPCQVPDFSGVALCLSLFRMILALSFSYIAYIMLTNVSPSPTFSPQFFRKMCYILSKACSASIGVIA